MPPPERHYDRNDLREPPARGEGGALRAFVLIALLGGAALAGGLYFGGGMGDFGNRAPREQVADAGSTTEPLDTPSGVPLGEPADVEPPPVQILDRGASTSATPRQQTTAATTPAATTPREQRAPTQTAATPGPLGVGGPISLIPGPGSPNSSAVNSEASSGSAAVTPTPSSSIAATPPQSDPSTLRAAAAVTWAQRPTARRISELYPARALREGMGGRVQLDCLVQADLSVACTIASESPAGEGFGRAALSASNAYRARPTLSDGSSAIGARTRIAVAFQAPQ
jgi:protein TonB